MIKRLFLLTGLVTLCLAVALITHSALNQKPTPPAKQAVLGENDSKSCGVLPPVNNVKINCPQCSKAQL